MSNIKTEKSPFKSRFSIEPLYISGAQFIAENMIDRQARKDGKVLPDKFWNSEIYKRNFQLQLRFANSLLKTYSVAAIISALRTPTGKRIYSLSAKWLDAIIKGEQERIDRENKKVADVTNVPEEICNNEFIPPSFPANKSELSKLKGL